MDPDVFHRQSSADSLELNRQGLLGPQQADSILKRYQFQRRIFLMVVISALGLPIMLLLFFMITEPAAHPTGNLVTAILPMGSLMMVSGLIYYLLLHRPIQAIQADISAGQVSTIEGRLTRLRSFYNDDYCFLTINQLRLKGAKSIYWPLVSSAKGKRMQAFYLPRSRVLVLLTVFSE